MYLQIVHQVSREDFIFCFAIELQEAQSTSQKFQSNNRAIEQKFLTQTFWVFLFVGDSNFSEKN